MGRVRGKDTSPEMKVRRLLWRMGRRYRLHRKDLPGTPDIVLPGRRTVVQVQGCFWHGHDCPRGGRQPKANADYWSAKIARNRARDARTHRALTEQGWRVIEVWECELKYEAALEARLRAALDQAT